MTCQTCGGSGKVLYRGKLEMHCENPEAEAAYTECEVHVAEPCPDCPQGHVLESERVAARNQRYGRRP